MRKIQSILTLLLLLTSLHLQAEEPPAEAYLIQPGDILRITVWKEEDLQREVIVRPDGMISFPLVGELAGAGQPVSGLREQIEARLEKYIPDPVVSVDVGELRGNTVYVIGKVNRPGAFPVTRNVDVMQALSMAGGMGTYAAANKIRILRRQGSELRAIPFEYGEIEKGENLEQNIVLQPGDVVVVP
ncbi:MAG: sugar transporter [Gammaproteobacteria bacterium]|nr:sugar transporter [Gammaproteobacteria bacterium]